jgi:hypothetical protein
MDRALQLVIEMNQWIWSRFKDDLKDATSEEVDWRPLPEANNISAILRHLRIEAEWHLTSLESGEPMPIQVTDGNRKQIDLATTDFQLNLKQLEEAYARFITALGKTTLPVLREHTLNAYRNLSDGISRPEHLLGFHQAMHLATHLGQIRSIRNLYRKTRGKPALFFPENPTFPT